MAVLLTVEHRHLVTRLGVAKANAHHKAVQLGFGQRKRTFILDGVLSRQDQKRLFHGIGHAVYGDLPLLHRFQEGGLGFRSGTVDLISEHNLGHDRARPELEFARFLIEHRNASHVTGEHVRRELDAAKVAAQRLGYRFGQHGFAGAGHIFDQDVTLA